MNSAKTIEETIQAVCVASPQYRGNQRMRALAGWAVLALVCAIIYLCWNHGGEIVGALWALLSHQDKPFIPSAQLFLWLIACLLVAAVVYETTALTERWAAVRDGKATDDLLVAIVQNPHIPQSAKVSLAREIEEHGYVSAEALSQIAERAEREAVVQKRQVDIQRARFAHELGPGATAMLNYLQRDEGGHGQG
ncbi:hypothetical protein [Burkholderia sp. BCC1993]|uniref:hypothetical protein n=1 Tax=Burkholderia sp. BCC1993 TaxID=2817444 RepID=UPI002AAF2FCB|nr:hypothetical protein [Burkholderia sp. BCC1993]